MIATRLPRVAMTRTRHGYADVYTTLWLARRISRLCTGDVPWRSRTRTRAKRIARAVPVRRR